MVTNISLNHPKATDWFQCKGADKIEPSEAEKIIIRALNGHEVEYYTEVSFLGMKYSTGNYARYDFWLPAYNTLIEYDGQEYHQTEDQLHRDKLKTAFCRKYKIRLERYNRYAYYKLGPEIAKLLQNLQQSGEARKCNKVTKKEKKKKVKKYKPQDTESAIERCHKGLQAPIETPQERWKRRSETKKKAKQKTKEILKQRSDKKKKEIKMSTWQPVPYKRIVII